MGASGRRARRAFEDFVQFLFRGEGDVDFEQKAVELRFGQRIRAFHFERVLRCHDEKRRFEGIRMPAYRDALFLHRFEKCGLRLGRRAVDFIGE